MIIHSIIPKDTIFSQNDCTEYHMKNVTLDNGAILQIKHNHDDVYEIVRIISTDPSHYLGKLYQPGTPIQLLRSKSFTR